MNNSGQTDHLNLFMAVADLRVASSIQKLYACCMELRVMAIEH